MSSVDFAAQSSAVSTVVQALLVNIVRAGVQHSGGRRRQALGGRMGQPTTRKGFRDPDAAALRRRLMNRPAPEATITTRSKGRVSIVPAGQPHSGKPG